MNTIHGIALALSMLLPTAAQAAQPGSDSIGGEIRRELAEARHEVHRDLAQARHELDTGNLSLGDSLRFGDKPRKDAGLPRAEITPQGDFLIEGKPLDIDLTQRRHLLAYRGRVLEIAKSGIDIGQRSAEAALDAVDGGLFSLMLGAMTGRLERRVERMVRQEIEPAVRGICRQLPAVMASQQRLATTLPEFRPYATMTRDDIDDCEDDVRTEFAGL